MSNFKNILDEDEFIIKEYKPDKKRFVLMRLMLIIPILVFSVAILSIELIIFDSMTKGYSLYGIVLLLLMIIVTLVSYLLVLVSYNKRLYAYTNKRVLIQKGFIGVDYKSLDLDVIGASEVRVDFLDKLARRNTGTIKFGSQATPANVQGVQAFEFSGIKDAYNVYREIKKHIDEVKNK